MNCVGEHFLAIMCLRFPGEQKTMYQWRRGDVLRTRVLVTLRQD